MKTNIEIAGKNILISWDAALLNETIRSMYSPWQNNNYPPDYHIIIEKSGTGFHLFTPLATGYCPDMKMLIYKLENTLLMLSRKCLGNYALLHAACVQIDGAGILFIGPHGSGKTTLAMTALTEQHLALSDDITIIDNDNRYALGFPRPFKITEPTWEIKPCVIPSDCPCFKVSSDMTYFFFNVPAGRYYAEKTEINLVVFPLRSNCSFKLRKLGETEAVRKGLIQGINFNRKEGGYLDGLLDIYRSADVYEMEYDNTFEAVKALGEMLK